MPINRKDADYHIHSAKARADLLCRAEAQGVNAFASLDDVADDPEMVTDFDVDAFLQQVREDRDSQSSWRSTNRVPSH